MDATLLRGMNLFYLDEDHDTNAKYHIDQHCTKMPLEMAEMLCMANIVSDVLGYTPRTITAEERAKIDDLRRNQLELGPPEERDYPYPGRLAHYNHPSTIWVRSSLENYFWTYCLAHAVDNQRRLRSGNPVLNKALQLIKKLPIPPIPDVGFTPFALAMKKFKDTHPEFVNEDDPIWSYRNFYMYDKHSFARWKHGEVPTWWKEKLTD